MTTSTNRVRLVRAVISGTLAGVALLIIRIVLDPPGGVFLAVLAALVLLTPTSRSYARRLLVGGAIVLGWVPLVWWLPLPASLDRVGLLVAILAACLTGWAAYRGRTSLSALLPRPVWADAIPGIVAVAAVWISRPALTAPSDGAALNLLIKSGWDHVAHFHMVRLIASEGSLLATTGTAADGSSWIGATYPKHFHALVATMIDLTQQGASAGDIEPNAYLAGTALTLAAAVTVLAAGIAQLPWLRRRAWLGLPLTLLGVAGFLLGPGTEALSAGFANFIFGACAAALSVLVAVTMARAVQPLYAMALAGLIAATAHSWLLLLPLAAASAIAIVFPPRLRWRGTRRQVGLTFTFVGAAAVSVLVAVLIVGRDLSTSTVLVGAAQAFEGPKLIVVLVLCVLTAVALRLRRRPLASSAAGRGIAVAGVAVVGTLALVAIGLPQLLQTGRLLYYFGKLASGTLLVSVVVLVVLVAVLSRRAATPRLPVAARIAVLILGSALAVQSFGYVGPAIALASMEQAPALTYRAAARVVGSGVSPEADRLLRAAEVSRAHPEATTLYYAAMENDPIRHLADQWHLALAHNWTADTDAPSSLLDRFASDDPLADLTGILGANDTILVIVAPELLPVTDTLPADYRARILSW